MKIKSLKLHPVAVERQYGTVIAMEGGTAKRTVKKSLFYFLEVASDNGHVGWGEVSDIEPDTLPKDVGEYGELLSAFLVGRNPFEVQRMHREFDEHFDARNSLTRYAQCALDMAMYDLAGQATGQPVHPNCSAARCASRWKSPGWRTSAKSWT